MLWANLLHIDQPPTQTREIVHQVADECYRKLVAILDRHPDAKVTLNINACLTEQLDRYGLGDVIAGIRALAERGQLELTGTAKYHPILPLIPEEEVRRQIELDAETNRAFFGDAYKPRGFFPPGMCINRRVLEIVAEMGFDWVIVDAIALDGTIGRSTDTACYELDGRPGFHVFFRERTHSHALSTRGYTSGAQFQRAVEPLLGDDGYMLTATEGEHYGHHAKGQETILSVAYKSGVPPTCTVSELLDRFPERRTTDPRPSSWSTWPDEMAQGIAYPQWNYPRHALHKLQWRLTNAVIQLVHSSQQRDGYAEARVLLDRGLHSCQYRWASCRLAWGTDMILRGAQQLVAAAEALDGVRTHKRVLDIQRLHRELHSTVWEWQHAGKPAEIKRAYKAAHAGVVMDEPASDGESQKEGTGLEGPEAGAQ
jgi:predicted glycosyl hydrolase (DUF1957 family)